MILIGLNVGRFIFLVLTVVLFVYLIGCGFLGWLHDVDEVLLGCQ